MARAACTIGTHRMDRMNPPACQPHLANRRKRRAKCLLCGDGLISCEGLLACLEQLARREAGQKGGARLSCEAKTERGTPETQRRAGGGETRSGETAHSGCIGGFQSHATMLPLLILARLTGPLSRRTRTFELRSSWRRQLPRCKGARRRPPSARMETHRLETRRGLLVQIGLMYL